MGEVGGGSKSWHIERKLRPLMSKCRGLDRWQLLLDIPQRSVLGKIESDKVYLSGKLTLSFFS